MPKVPAFGFLFIFSLQKSCNILGENFSNFSSIPNNCYITYLSGDLMCFASELPYSKRLSLYILSRTKNSLQIHLTCFASFIHEQFSFFGLHRIVELIWFMYLAKSSLLNSSSSTSCSDELLIVLETVLLMLALLVIFVISFPACPFAVTSFTSLLFRFFSSSMFLRIFSVIAFSLVFTSGTL